MESPINDWLPWDEAFRLENTERLDTDPTALCNYGIKLLDDALFKIGKNELIVIGAETGMGKSELSLAIAQHNAKQNKKVALYYLEGGHQEAIRRMKWKDIATEYYKKQYGYEVNMDFIRWLYNDLKSPLLEEIEAEIYKRYKEKYKDNLYLYPVTKDFTLDTLMMSLLSFHQLLSQNLGLDLIILDHLQYFSLGNTENEITEITKILRKVKEITEHYNTPVILVSHLRKRGKGAGLPTHEDFYGSGNIAKISNTSIMISPATDRDSYSKNLFPTYFRFVKSRVGVRTNYAFLVDFDMNTRSYGDNYDIFRVNNMGQVASEALSNNEKPKWARRNNGSN